MAIEEGKAHGASYVDGNVPCSGTGHEEVAQGEHEDTDQEGGLWPKPVKKEAGEHRKPCTSVHCRRHGGDFRVAEIERGLQRALVAFGGRGATR